MPWVRTLFSLGRLAWLPTVWSNCLAGWWLGGAGHRDTFGLLIGGVTLLHLGSAFLHDALGIDFDRRQRRERPIPSGAIGLKTVWRYGLGLTAAGTLALFFVSRLTGGLALAVVCVLVLYSTFRRQFTFAPVLPGTCRMLLYLMGASVADHGITGWALWCGLALGAYVTGMGYLARTEAPPALPSNEGPASSPTRSTATPFVASASNAGSKPHLAQRPPSYWPVLLLLCPICLALIMNAGPYREAGLLLCAVVSLWALRYLRYTYWSPEPDVPRTIAGLRAAIVFVDWLATCPAAVLTRGADAAPRELSFSFIALFLATLLLEQLGRSRPMPSAVKQ